MANKIKHKQPIVIRTLGKFLPLFTHTRIEWPDVQPAVPSLPFALAKGNCGLNSGRCNKLIVAQLVKKLPAFYGTRNIIAVYNCAPTGHTLNWWFQFTPSETIFSNYILILSSNDIWVYQEFTSLVSHTCLISHSFHHWIHYVIMFSHVGSEDRLGLDWRLDLLTIYRS
jgi:hypothetical protein